MNHLLLRALRCQSDASRPPVWLMRQAGRYLPDYRELRAKYPFLTLCHQPELAAEVTLLPLKQFDLDAAILFSDILVLPEALGMKLHFSENGGPLFERPLYELSDITSLPRQCGEKLLFVSEAICLVKKRYRGPLVGFSGAPFTLASYMIEGKTSRSFKKTKHWMFSDPDGFHLLLQRLTDEIVLFLKQQIRAGVDVVQLFDSWAHVLSDFHFRQFCAPYLKQIVECITEVPVIVFCRGSSIFAPLLAQMKPAAISLDWQANLQQMRRTVGSKIALQGNLDPEILCASPKVVKEHVRQMVRQMQRDRGYIFNLGHGILPETPLESVEALIEAVHHA